MPPPAYFIHHIVVKYQPEPVALHDGDVVSSETNKTCFREKEDLKFKTNKM